jgi:hypothetical protein
MSGCSAAMANGSQEIEWDLRSALSDMFSHETRLLQCEIDVVGLGLNNNWNWG